MIADQSSTVLRHCKSSESPAQGLASAFSRVITMSVPSSVQLQSSGSTRSKSFGTFSSSAPSTHTRSEVPRAKSTFTRRALPRPVGAPCTRTSTSSSFCDHAYTPASPLGRCSASPCPAAAAARACDVRASTTHALSCASSGNVNDTFCSPPCGARAQRPTYASPWMERPTRPAAAASASARALRGRLRSAPTSSMYSRTACHPLASVGCDNGYASHAPPAATCCIVAAEGVLSGPSATPPCNIFLILPATSRATTSSSIEALSAKRGASARLSTSPTCASACSVSCVTGEWTSAGM
mmetsp:Transcript_22433/g.47258  ORF Transcript_22433/g.47258 Transcript_22433/m.47258 type:complete len:297 (+) Transcript_22433:822-1712(+)